MKSPTCRSGFGSGSGSWAAADGLGAGQGGVRPCSEVHLHCNSGKGEGIYPDGLAIPFPRAHCLSPCFCPLFVPSVLGTQRTEPISELESPGRGEGQFQEALPQGAAFHACSWGCRRQGCLMAPFSVATTGSLLSPP